MRKDGRSYGKNDITVIGETDKKIMVRWNRPHPGRFRAGKRYAFRHGLVVRIDPRTGREIPEDRP